MGDHPRVGVDVVKYPDGDNLGAALYLVDIDKPAHDFGNIAAVESGGFDAIGAAQAMLHIGKALVLVGVDIAESLRDIRFFVEGMRGWPR